MKGIAWGELYNKYKDKSLDAKKLEAELEKLMMDDEVTNKKGVYPYVLSRDERHLNLRAFSDSQKRKTYEKQKGICPMCKEHFEIEQMEADHITPWSQGGKTMMKTAKCCVKSVIGVKMINKRFLEFQTRIPNSRI